MKKSILIAFLAVVGAPAIVGAGTALFYLGSSQAGANPIPVPPDGLPEHAYNPVRELSEELSIGEPWHYRNLTIFPVSTSLDQSSTGTFPTMDSAIEDGTLEIREKGDGEVNTVLVRNDGKSFVFGMAGDMIIGAKQDRMLKNDIIIRPQSGWIEVEVYCTEHGRWTEGSEKFGSTRLVVPGTLRAKAAATSSQAEVWVGVEAEKDALGDQAGTTALKSIYSNRDIERKSQPYLDELQPLATSDGQTVGVLVAVSSRILVLDVFAFHQLLYDMWGKLLRSYVIDALSKSGTGSLDKTDAEAYVASLHGAAVRVRPNQGAGGKLYAVSTDVGRGSALVLMAKIIHLDLFPDNSSPSSDQGSPTPSLEYRRGNR